MHAIKIITKITFQRRINIIFILSFFLFTNILLLSYYHPDISIMEFLSFSMRSGQIGFSFFIFFAYECLSDITKSEYIETISLLKKEKNQLIITQIIILLFIVLSWSVLICLWHLGIYLFLQVNYISYIVHMILAVILNCLIPGSIATLIGSILGFSFKRTSAYCLILLFLVLTSNIPSSILYSVEFLDIPILDYLDWFSIQMPNSNFVADSVYGISIEVYRWVLAVGWLSVLTLFIISRTITCSIRKKRIICFSLLLVTIIAGCRFSQRQDDSIVRKDYRSDGTLLDEVTYRNNALPLNSEAPSFQVIHYDLDITITSNMHISAWLTLDQLGLKTYDFTLWHNLKIIRIVDSNGNSIPYDRSGDYISIYVPNNTKKICIEYNGHCGKYFSNYQGIALPGYVPYYPMAGHISIWDYTKQEINTQRPFTKKDFAITVKSNLNVYCNLPSISHNSFSGTAETVSIYAGLLSEINTNTQHIYRSPVSYPRSIMVGYENHWKKLSNLVGETIKLDLNQKTIFVQPETIMVTKSSNENLVIFEDHIILGSWALSPEAICRNYLFSLIPESDETNLISNLFKQQIAFGNANSNCKVPQLSDLLILTKYKAPNYIQDENEWNNYLDAKKLYEDLWNYKVASLGESVVLKTVYEYLLSTDRKQNQVDFLFMLGVD